MKNNILFLSIIALSTLIFVQCNKKQQVGKVPTLPSEPYNYTFSEQTKTVLETTRDNTPSHNKLTNAGATLGRVLFYDTRMSINNNTSCGSCHHQAKAFADPVALSTGFEGGKTSRNASSILNVINQESYFWDGRTVGLETMVLQPIRHQVEMGMEKPEILPKKLATAPYYAQLFENAFGTQDITAERIGMALSQFLRSMTSYNSKADQTGMILPGGFGGGWGSVTDPRVTQEEKNGAALFNSLGCDNCHNGDNLRGMNDEGVANIGLDLEYADQGMGEMDASKKGMFKIPSLRNVSLTAPYMHDGRFATLKDVLNHYNSGVQDHPNLHATLRNNSWGGGDNKPRKLNLTDKQMDDIIAFLNTLTEDEVVSDVKFSDPFK
jgi:cytochrome c peroxidase